ncbi:hypothetical protein ING2E5A_1465 [Petrimonas mucosa]|jgi:hypothetical protein|uniref:Uncharacterized protein n=1 Tax=Petrimonas mucosa TaxID=1642646 RepID=A0A1G4G736_9BACT|nr:hypothetical protein ING2E5A_1465 [Petrimonas mucosa]SFU63723.1 hypothetical protein SAMN05216364_104411 [Porphyromonadaceae bacterium KHP3R9]
MVLFTDFLSKDNTFYSFVANYLPKKMVPISFFPPLSLIFVAREKFTAKKMKR